MAIIYIMAGIYHFIKPNIYLRIMPEYMPNHKFLVYLSGIFEIILGISICIPYLKNISIIGIICMLLIFLLVHINMLKNNKSSLGIPKWILILRFPIQFGLIYWAYIYLKL
jgi:uncharacterized membrane protein